MMLGKVLRDSVLILKTINTGCVGDYVKNKFSYFTSKRAHEELNFIYKLKKKEAASSGSVT